MLLIVFSPLCVSIMGRHLKTVNSECGRERREIGYYSTPSFVAQFLVQKLIEISPHGKYVIDPCVGKGELVKDFKPLGKEITGIDIIDFESQYNHLFLKEDFIKLYKNSQEQNLFEKNILDFSIFDYWIANPPYNCHEVNYIQKNKQELKRIFNDIGVHNMYSMFISAIIDLASKDSVIGLITLDSFLTSKVHYNLRKKILEETQIHYLLLCPTDLFHEQKADVRTCILILQKGKNKGQRVHVCNRPKSTVEFQKILAQEKFTLENEEDIFLFNPTRDNLEFILEVPEDIKMIFNNFPRLSDSFTCITGISTGNDSKYLSTNKKTGFSIPFYKNPGTRKFFTEPDCYLCDDFLNISKQVKNFIVRNSHLLYQGGITCSSMGVEFSACYLPPNSTYGVNANIICNDDDLWWLLAYLNSKLVSYLVRGVLIRTNMITSGYVARIPIPSFNEVTKLELSRISKNVYQNIKQNKNYSLEKDIDLITYICFKYLEISPSTRDLIYEFNSDLVRST